MSLLTAITGISTSFISLAPEDIDDGIRRALQTVGELAGAIAATCSCSRTTARR